MSNVLPASAVAAVAPQRHLVTEARAVADNPAVNTKAMKNAVDR